MTDSLEEATKNHFSSLIDLGIKCECFDEAKKLEYVEMVMMMDQGIFEKSIRLDNTTLKSIWGTFVTRITY
jgi:hypothetical protein